MKNRSKKIIKWIVSLIGILGIGYIGLMYFALNVLSKGCGMDDGPFEAASIDPIELSQNFESLKLSNNGVLVIDNRNDSLTPILTLFENEKIVWTLDTDTRNTEGYESTSIWELNQIKIEENANSIQLNFIAYWTFGGERGSMQIDRNSGKNSFCLSW